MRSEYLRLENDHSILWRCAAIALYFSARLAPVSPPSVRPFTPESSLSIAPVEFRSPTVSSTAVPHKNSPIFLNDLELIFHNCSADEN
ncbi:MAG: hypothetical protein F6K28_45060 [Microcoleus sp. SIO2G3]|nr:hypothetical protein [Microcoleus sp. SIO2G3]